MVSNVLFFGGTQSTEQNIKDWEASATIQKPDIKFVGYPYPANASPYNPVSKFNIKPVVQEIINNHATQYTIVGHSSGAAIANAIAEEARVEHAGNFSLIDLDGFAPSQALQALPVTSIWSACNWAHDNIVSLNYEALKKSKNFHVFKSNCTKLWPLHFSLVNLNTDDSYPFISQGYRNVKANLIWLV